MKVFIGNVPMNLDYYSGIDSYSDGDIEQEMLDAVINGEASAAEFLTTDRRWPMLYHFSPMRRNLLEGYDFDKDASLLEIGAGCGALTGLFSEKVKKVTAVELSKRRAEILAHRHKDKNNLEVIVGNLNDIQLKEKYDYITLIGVLEYAGKYTETENPYVHFLQGIMEYLKPDGVLIIAIENKFGLKYWAGCVEDHTGKLFDGIEGYPNESKIRTFSKNELIQLLSSAGLNQQRFYYPVPDYKLPTQVFSDRMLPSITMLDYPEPNFNDDRIVLFNEKLAVEEIIKDGCYDFFANSFLVFCKTNKAGE